MNYLETKILKIADSINKESESYDMREFIKLTKSLQITELEPLLNEDDYNEEKLQTNKYFFLSVLRDIFNEFKKLGENELEYYRGECEGCEFNKDKVVYIFEGVASKKRFGFIPIKQDSPHMGFHFCYGFTDRNGERADNCYHFMLMAAIKMNEFKERGIST